MKKILAIVLGLTLAFTMMLTGCGGSSEGEEQNAHTPDPKFDISDIEWTVQGGVVDGYRRATLNYTNNSKFDIIDFNLQFKLKDDVTEDQVKEYSELSQKAADMEEDIMEMTFECYTSKAVGAGETIENQPCTLDGTIQYYTDVDSYELFEPDLLTVVYLSGDTLYTVYHDYVNDSTTSGETHAAYEWPETEFAKSLPKPDSKLCTIGYEGEDSISAYVYAATRDEFEAYVEKCKQAGFEKVIESDAEGYEASNGEGITVDIDFYTESDEIYIDFETE